MGGSLLGKIANRQVLVDTMGQAKLADFGCAKVWCIHPARPLGHSIADIDAHRMSSYTLIALLFVVLRFLASWVAPAATH